MCHFMSWTKYRSSIGKEVILFLTDNDIYNTKRGGELIKYCQNPQDLVGHGAIDFYYEIAKKGGIHEQCTDFSTPENFPQEVAECLKAGKMKRMGVMEEALTVDARQKYSEELVPLQLRLNEIENPAWKEYEAILNRANSEYNKIKDPALEGYKKIIALTRREYNRTVDLAYKELAYEELKVILVTAQEERDKIVTPAKEKYDKITALAQERFHEARGQLFWDFFSDITNRVNAWK